MGTRDPMFMFRLSWLIVLALTLGTRPGIAASDHYGQVTFAGLPVPGATVTATQGEMKKVTVSDEDGLYRLVNLADGSWTIRIEMLGFALLSREVTVPATEAPPTWELALLPFTEITRGLPPPVTAPTQVASQPAAGGRNATARRDEPPTRSGSAPATPSAPAAQRGFQRAGVNTVAAPPPAPPAPDDAPPEGGMGAADGLLINGSVNNGASSPFALPRAFGNSRPGQRSLYNGMVGGQFGNSSWDARPFSLTGQQAAKPSYNDAQLLSTFGGPVTIPGLRNRANFFVGYQRTSDHNAITQSALMPTSLERAGDFSQTRDPLGRSLQILDPSTSLPFAGNVIPRDRISPQAAALLGYYPLPTSDAAGSYNFQAPIFTATRQDNLQTRLGQSPTGRDQLTGTVAYQRTATDTTTVFGFEDASETSGLDAQANWSHRFSQFLSVRPRYQYTRLTNSATPYFSNRTNVSGDAGITGNNQDPINWGPPRLTFSSGVESLVDAQPAFTRNQTHAASTEGYWYFRGRHNLTFGGDVRWHDIDILSQQNPRGAFSFTGAASGSDLADFLLGIPSTSDIAFGNADKYFRARSYDAYITDDWRISPALTLNLGVRWEYEAPITERFGRLVNLDVASGFGTVSPVVAGDPTGTVTGARYPTSLLRPDKSGFQPRLAMAWRPVPGSSLVVRAGYGIYRNTNVYQSIATLLAQQPPLSTTFSIENTAANPLTLARGFVGLPGRTLNTFAVDPDFRPGYAHNWQASVQRDLPASLTIAGTYLGSKGSQLMQEFLPNTYPAGAVNPCPACPSGFVYLTSNGGSLRNAGQIQLRRRLRNGFTASIQYTLAKAEDDAGAFTGVSLSGAAIAQDWLNLDAEHGPSNFDQRHQVTAQVQYTTGAGVTGGTLLDGLKGSLFKDWTFTSQITTGSGLPLTPLYFRPVSGIMGQVRADTTGAPIDAARDGYYLNPAAYTTPAPGQWGNARRNSITGPSQFSMNASVARTFRVGDRLNMDWRIDATNVLNRVTYANVNTFITSPQFGLPNRTNDPRHLRTTLRVRF